MKTAKKNDKNRDLAPLMSTFSGLLCKVIVGLYLILSPTLVYHLSNTETTLRFVAILHNISLEMTLQNTFFHRSFM